MFGRFSLLVEIGTNSDLFNMLELSLLIKLRTRILNIVSVINNGNDESFCRIDQASRSYQLPKLF